MRSISKNAVYTVVSIGVAAILLVIWFIPTSPQQRNNALNSEQDASRASVIRRFGSLSDMPETYDEVVSEVVPEPKQVAIARAKRKEESGFRKSDIRKVNFVNNREKRDEAAGAPTLFGFIRT